MTSDDQTTESGDTEVRTLRTVEYGLRDLGGEVVTDTAWQSADAVTEALRKHGYDPAKFPVVARTTTTTVTTTGWEAAR